MVVQLLLRDGGDLPLSQLPEDAQARLTRELGALNIVDKATLEDVAREFARELSDVALTPPGSVEAALKSLDGRISPATVARLREEAATRAGRDPWQSVIDLDTEDMLPISANESPEVSAVLLSKLPTSKAAELLGMMPGDRARRIAFAMSKIGAILNSSAAATRDQVLEGLLSEDPKFGEGVRKAIFTFEDIPSRLAPPDVPKILRDIDQADLITALAHAAAVGGPQTASSDHLLNNMSTRMADGLREELGERGKVKPSDGEAAQTAVVTAIRGAVDAGTITLIVEDDE